MFKLHTVQAQFGDSLILEYGTKSKSRFLLIDGGPSGTFTADLDSALRTIVQSQKLDLVILSHIDTDHITGLLDLLASLEEDDANGTARHLNISGLWHNSFQKVLDPNGDITQRMQALVASAGAVSASMPFSVNAFFGVKEGNRLRILAKKLKLPVNKGFQDDVIMLETATKVIKLGKLSLRVIGPDQTNLDALRTEWLEWLSKTEKKMGSAPTTLANSDKSVPNLSSIILLASCDGKTILLTGDARSDHVLAGLKKTGLLTDGKLHVNVLKLPHHGSSRNATMDFFKTVIADTYVVSANGKYGNPDYETLKWIVESANADGRPIEIIATNLTPTIKELQQTHKPKDFGYRLTVRPKNDHCITLQLA